MPESISKEGYIQHSDCVLLNTPSARDKRSITITRLSKICFNTTNYKVKICELTKLSVAWAGCYKCCIFSSSSSRMLGFIFFWLSNLLRMQVGQVCRLRVNISLAVAINAMKIACK